MGRKFSILVAFCVVLFGAILAGYWDMIDSQKLREVRDRASASVGRLTGASAGDGAATAGANPPKAPDAVPAANGATGTESSPGAPAASDNRTASAGNAGQQPAASSSLPKPGDTRPVMPSFDVLRVEPDGSAVLAGRAAPNAEIRLMDGATAIGRAKASPEGDFAVVLDDRLTAGDHQIRIEADKGDGVKAISEQTAIVSVPKAGQGGELLAMVETPNQPSRIINLPTSKSPPEAQTAASDTQPVAPPAPPPPVASPTGGAPATKDGTGVVPRATPTATPPAARPAPGAADQRAAVASRETGTADAPAAAGRPAAPSTFAVEAVEIENGTIYIAGRAPGTAPVRVYVDNKFVGEDKARSNERFLVTAKAPLAVGDHEIRADMIAGNGAVVSRVEVPFAKPEGETMSAIASNEQPDGAAMSEGGETPSPAPKNPSVAATSETAASSGRPANVPVAGRQPQATEAASPPTDAPRRPVANEQASIGGTGRPGPGDAAPASTPADAPAEQATIAPSNVVAATQPGEAAPIAAPSAAQEVQPSTAPADNRIETIRQAALEGVHTRVLIRRGDTLWRISRETYGQGRRYTVIYLANGDQIRNPNRIYPGQLFRLPKDDSKAID